jgi:hypothetical protein
VKYSSMDVSFYIYILRYGKSSAIKRDTRHVRQKGKSLRRITELGGDQKIHVCIKKNNKNPVLKIDYVSTPSPPKKVGQSTINI